LNLQIIKKKIY